MKNDRIRILLVEDDEDDYVIIQDVISEIKYMQIELTWADNYDSALEAAKNGAYDIFIIDYFLRGFTGLDLIGAFRNNGLRKPVIVLTGQGDHGIDLQAMAAGASDYLEKDKITPPLLEKVIRYAIAQSEILESLKESEEQLRVLSARLIDAQESEKKRIAKDLHDSIGSNLAAIKFEIQKQQMSFSPDATPPSPPCFTNLNDLLNETIEETRRICMSLRPSVLDDLGIIIAIQWFCRKFGQIYSTIRIQNDLKADEKEIPEPIKIVVYRVIQEALNNAAKHSNATVVHILFEKRRDNIFLTITDNGCGFDVKAKRTHRNDAGGIGLLSMVERVSGSGGSLRISSDGNSGTEIRAVWPGGTHGDFVLL
ncbi:MAG: response regulator [Desulfosalsimonadaceae bacterium]